MAQRQIGHRQSSLVLTARFPVVKWRSRSVAKSAYYLVNGELMVMLHETIRHHDF